MTARNLCAAVILTIAAFGLSLSHAQDPGFTQSYLSRIYLNPATAGSEKGVTVFANYRNQWSNVPGGFNTASMAMDMQFPRYSSGFGVHAYYDAAGTAAIRTTAAGLTYAYILRASQHFNIHFGLGATYIHKSLDLGSLVFSDMIDPVDGVTGGTDATVASDRTGFLDLDAGMLFRGSFSTGRKQIHTSAGLAVHHLTMPVESFQEQESRLPRRYTVHFGAMIPMSGNYSRHRSVFYISPVLKYERQAGVDIMTAGFFNTYRPVFLGVFYQDNGIAEAGGTRAVIFTGGLNGTVGESTDFTLGYSYDHNLSGVTNVTGGIHELAIKANLARGHGKNKMKPGKQGTKCYEFNGKGSIRLF